MSVEHDHHHDHEEKFGLVLFLNLFFALIELIGAMLSNSQALLADAIHDAGDSASILLAIYFNKKAKKGANNKYTYGYKRYRLVGALITSTVLMVGSSLVLFNSIVNFNNYDYLNTKIMFVVAILGLISNLIGVVKLKSSKKLLSRSIMLHLLEDVLGWIGLIVISITIHFTGWLFLDSLLSIIISIFIIYQAIKNLKALTLVFLNVTPSEIDIEEIKNKILAVNGVEEINDVHVYMIDEDLINFTCHIIGRSNTIDPIRAILYEYGIVHITIQIEDEYCDVEKLHLHN